MGVAKDAWIGDDIVLDSDAAVIKFGDNQDVTLTHVHDSGLSLSAGVNMSQLEIISTEADNAHGGSLLKLNRDSASPADNDYLGQVGFYGDNDAGENIRYGRMIGTAIDVTDGTEDGGITIQVIRAGTLQNAIIIDFDSTDVYGRLYAKSLTNDATTFSLLCQNSDNTNNFYVASTGIISTGADGSSPYNNTTAVAADMRVASSGILYRSTSSALFKTNVEPIDDTWADKILDMQPIYYKSIATGDVGVMPENWTHYGFSAEQVATVDPRLVSFKTHEYHTEGEEGEEGEEVATELDEPIADGVQYVKMIPALVNLIKRQRDEISALTARVLALET